MQPKKVQANLTGKFDGKNSLVKTWTVLFRENHPKTIKDQTCVKCEKVYCTKRLLRLHKSEEHGLKVISREKKHGFKKGFSCSISHPVAFFQTVEELNEHVRNEHIEDNTEHACDTCSQNFCSTRVLDLHYVSEHEDRRFTCPQCLKVKLVTKEL